MLGTRKNIVFVIVFHNLAEYYMFNHLTADGCDGYRAIIRRCGSVTFLVDWERFANLNLMKCQKALLDLPSGFWYILLWKDQHLWSCFF